MSHFYDCVIVIGTTIVLISFLLSYKYTRNKSIPFYLKYFFIYTFFVLILSLSSVLYSFNRSYPLHIAISIQDTFLVVDLIFWGYFFYSLKELNFKKIRIFILLILFIVLTLSVLVNIDKAFKSFAIGITNFGKCSFCLVYFFKLFNVPPTVILKEDPVFWIIIGLFSYTAVTIPIYITETILMNIKEMNSIRVMLFTFTNIAVIIMHLFFIKSYLCIANINSNEKK